MNLYLFGGTFDPPHIAHKKIIEHFIKKSDLFVLSPTYKSPFKNDFSHLPFLHREKMLKLMLHSYMNDNMIIINTVNKMNFKEMKEYKSKIQTFISKELNNYSLTIDIRLSEETDKKTFLDSKEKLKIIQNSNNSINSLIEEFKLRI